MDWLSLAKTLRTGQKMRLEHDCCDGKPICISKQPTGYLYHCFSCKETKFEPIQTLSLREIEGVLNSNTIETQKEAPPYIAMAGDDFSNAGLAWLGLGGITGTNMKDYDIRYSEKIRRVVIPLHFNGVLTGYIARNLFDKGAPKYLMYPVLKYQALSAKFNKEPPCDSVVIVEDALSAIRVGKFVPCIAMLGTTMPTAVITDAMEYKQVVAWTDADQGGIEADKYIKESLGGLVDSVTSIRTPKDPKEYSDAELQRIVRQGICSSAGCSKCKIGE